MTETRTLPGHAAPVLQLTASPYPATLVETVARTLAGLRHQPDNWGRFEHEWCDTFRRIAHRVISDIAEGNPPRPGKTLQVASVDQVADMDEAAADVVDALDPGLRTSRHPAARAARLARIHRARTALLHAVALRTP